MDRRSFLQLLGVGAASAAAPKLIFDMGANLWRYGNQIERIQVEAFDFCQQIGVAATLRNGKRFAVRLTPPLRIVGETHELITAAAIVHLGVYHEYIKRALIGREFDAHRMCEVVSNPTKYPLPQP